MRGEDRLTAWLQSRPETARLIGDDAAFLETSGPLAVTVDSQVEGVHFLPGLEPGRIARRLLAVNLSDLAACGAMPAAAFLALNTPPGFDHRAFLRPLLDAAHRLGFRLAGGDLARAAHVSATLTLLGRLPRGGRFVRRSAARPGDRLWVGGTLGEAAAGLLVQQRAAGGTFDPTMRSAPGPAARRARARHLLPSPQLELGRWLGRQPRAAALDISDGLARDLHRLCRASGVGATIEAACLPQATGSIALCAALEADPLTLVLAGGEDYVLLFALPPESQPPKRFGAVAIGEITATRRVRLRREGKQARALALDDLGHDHLQSRQL